MTKIFKYELDLTGKQEITFPQGFVPLHVGYDWNNRLCIWTQINDNADKERETIYIVGTGQELPDAETEYLGTAKDESGYIWHVFLKI
jgi:hypothetical protein